MGQIEGRVAQLAQIIQNNLKNIFGIENRFGVPNYDRMVLSPMISTNRALSEKYYFRSAPFRGAGDIHLKLSVFIRTIIDFVIAPMCATNKFGMLCGKVHFNIAN